MILDILYLHSNKRYPGDWKTSQKKMVSRNVAVALGIICIILAVGLVGAILDLQNQVNNLNNTLSLAKSTVWVNNQTITLPQDSWHNWTFKAPYAGYVLVQAYDSGITKAEVVYSYHGINYDQQTDVGRAFPIMPSSIEIRVGNDAPIYNDSRVSAPINPYPYNYGNNVLLNQILTVTITYYY
jgi:hypothetical protein